MGDSKTAVATAGRTPGVPHPSFARISQEYGDTLGVRRPASGTARSSDDLTEPGLSEPGPSDPHHRPGPVPEQLEEIPDVEYDASLWTEAEHEGFGAPGRRAA